MSFSFKRSESFVESLLQCLVPETEIVPKIPDSQCYTQVQESISVLEDVSWSLLKYFGQARKHHLKNHPWKDSKRMWKFICPGQIHQM